MAFTPSNRYATPPVSPARMDPAKVAGTYGLFRKNGVLKNLLICLLVTDALLTIFNVGFLNSLAVDRLENTGLAAPSPELAQIIEYTLHSHLVVMLLIAVFFFTWVNRACKNAWLLDPPRMKTTPAMAVGYYFIPILFLWKPYTSMREIRSASYGKDHAIKKLLPLWWTFTLMVGFVIVFTQLQRINTGDQEAQLTTLKLLMVTTPLRVVLDYLAIALITGITLAQQRRLINWHQ